MRAEQHQAWGLQMLVPLCVCIHTPGFPGFFFSAGGGEGCREGGMQKGWDAGGIWHKEEPVVGQWDGWALYPDSWDRYFRSRELPQMWGDSRQT